MLKNEIRSSYMTLHRKEREGLTGLTGKLVLQCANPHLIGKIKFFGPSVVSEAQRILFEQNVPDYLWYRYPGTRIYLHIEGTYWHTISDDIEYQFAGRFANVARDMMQEAIESGLVTNNDLKYYTQRPREEYHYTDEEVDSVIDDLISKGFE